MVYSTGHFCGGRRKIAFGGDSSKYLVLIVQDRDPGDICADQVSHSGHDCAKQVLQRQRTRQIVYCINKKGKPSFVESVIADHVSDHVHMAYERSKEYPLIIFLGNNF